MGNQKEDRIHDLKRPAIERMLRIHTELKQDRLPNCTKLARELEVSTKTISRDIDFMRDRMLLPIEYDASQHGYFYTREVESLPTIDISEGELLAIAIARKSLDHYKGTPFEKPLATAFNKIAASLPDTITANLADLSETVSFKQSRQSRIDENLLNAAIKAAMNRTTIEFDYKKPGETAPKKRVIDPYHVTNYQGKWYMLGRDHDRSAIRTFLLTRASNLNHTNNVFPPVIDFSADDYLWSSFGIYSPVGEHHVKIRFSTKISEYISENLWHTTQVITPQPDGSILLELKLGSLIELSPWLISWGPHAEALEPIELRKMVRDQALAVAKTHSD